MAEDCAMCRGGGPDRVMERLVELVEGEGSTLVFTIGGHGKRSEPGSIPPFAYTVGMWRNFGAPEIMTYVIPGNVLNEVRERVREGLVVHPHKRLPNIANNLDVVFAEITGDDDVFHWTRRYYQERGKPGDINFPRMQLIWPDEFNTFPWEEAFNEKFLDCQIELGDWPEKGAKI